MLAALGSYLRRHHVAMLALFIALGGSAYAAATVGPRDIQKNAVRSKHIKSQQVRSADVANQNLRGADVRDDSLTGADVSEPSLGPVPQIAPGVAGTAAFDVLPAVKARRIGPAQTIPHGAAIQPISVEYNAESLDTAAMHDVAAGANSRLTAPVGGIYAVSARVHWESDPDGTRELRISKNGETFGVEGTNERVADGTDYQQVTTLVSLAAGGYVEAKARQTSGEELGIRFTPGTAFTMHWVGPSS